MNKRIVEIHFSPSGRSKVVSDIFVENFKKDVESINFMEKDDLPYNYLSKDDLLIVNMPVFSGRIPGICEKKLRKLKGEKTKAVAIVSYGNRNYDDALLELVTILKEQNFEIVSAAAFITKHSIFPEVAKNRPDEIDKKDIDDFYIKTMEKIKKDRFSDLEIKGNIPFKNVKPPTLMPTGDENCINCGECVKICPVNAINIEDPKKTENNKCINCTACIYICSVNSRGYYTKEYEAGYEKFKAANNKRMKPEIYL